MASRVILHPTQYFILLAMMFFAAFDVIVQAPTLALIQGITFAVIAVVYALVTRDDKEKDDGK